MGVLATSCGLAAFFLGASAFYYRRRLVRSWIDVRHDPTDLTGQTIILTGGNTGIGFQVVLDLARRNAHVVIACRHVDKGQQAVQQIQNATGNANVECLPLDLASIDSVRTFAAQVQELYKDKQMKAFIFNAGVWMPMEYKQKTNENFEIRFGVNHLAHFELTRLLVIKTQWKTQDCRVIFVSSTLARQGKYILTQTNL